MSGGGQAKEKKTTSTLRAARAVAAQCRGCHRGPKTRLQRLPDTLRLGGTQSSGPP